MNQFVEPRSGRICVRKLSEGFALIGVIHVPAGSFKPKELAGYPMTISNLATHLTVSPTMVDSGPAEAMSLDECATMPIWRTGCLPDIQVNIARFVRAYEGSDSFNFLSITKADPFAAYPGYHQFAYAAHYLIDIEDGFIRPSNLQAPPNGLALSQLLNDLAIWPNEDGIEKTATPLTSKARELYDLANQVRLDYIAGNLAPNEYEGKKQLLLESGILINTDRDFLSFIKAQQEYGMLTPAGASKTSNELKKINLFSSIVIREIITNDGAINYDKLDAKLSIATDAIRSPFFGSNSLKNNYAESDFNHHR